MVDYHIHSCFSFDGEMTPQALCDRFESAGYTHIGISDHVDYDYCNGIQSNVDFDASFAAFQSVREGTKLQIAMGVEAGYAPGTSERYLGLQETYPFDYTINSVHMCGGMDAYDGEFYRGKSKQQAYSAYLQTIYESLNVLYDYEIVGHIGYVCKYAPYPDREMHVSEFGDL